MQVSYNLPLIYYELVSMLAYMGKLHKQLGRSTWILVTDQKSRQNDLP